MRNPPLRATSEHSPPLYLGHHADQEVVLLDGRLGESDVVLQDLAGGTYVKLLLLLLTSRRVVSGCRAVEVTVVPVTDSQSHNSAA